MTGRIGNIVFMGAPGSGKGTQAKLVSQKFDIPTISTGDLLRSEVANGSELGILAKKYMNNGALVPDDCVVGMVKSRIAEKDCQNGFILDGFPRNISQAVSLDDGLKSMSKSISLVLMIDVPDEVIIKRISGRFSCKDCGSLYNKFFSNTKLLNVCDECGSNNFLNREDDNEEAVKKRLEVYHYNSEKLVDFYTKKDLLYKVDGLKPVDLVTRDIMSIISLHIK